MLNHNNKEPCTCYTDAANNVRQVRHTVIFTEEEKRELEDKIVEDLYRIFTQQSLAY